MALDEMFDADKAWAVQVSVRSAVGATASRAVGEWGEGECQKARMLCSAVASLEETDKDKCVRPELKRNLEILQILPYAVCGTSCRRHES